MTGPCDPRITHFPVSCFGVSHAAGILWEIEVPESPGDGVRHVAFTIMRTYRESAVGRSRPMRDLLVGQDPGWLIGRQFAVHDLVSPDSPGLAFRDHRRPGDSRTDVCY